MDCNYRGTNLKWSGVCKRSLWFRFRGCVSKLHRGLLSFLFLGILIVRCSKELNTRPNFLGLCRITLWVCLWVYALREKCTPLHFKRKYPSIPQNACCSLNIYFRLAKVCWYVISPPWGIDARKELQSLTHSPQTVTRIEFLFTVSQLIQTSRSREKRKWSPKQVALDYNTSNAHKTYQSWFPPMLVSWNRKKKINILMQSLSFPS